MKSTSQSACVNILIARKLVEDESGCRLCSDGGFDAFIPKLAQDFDWKRKLLTRSRDYNHPIGIVMRDSMIIDNVLWADRDVVSAILDEADGKVSVFFQGHDGVFHLAQDACNHAAIRTGLEKSRTTGNPIWFVVGFPDLELLALTAAEPEAIANIPFAFPKVETIAKHALPHHEVG